MQTFQVGDGRGREERETREEGEKERKIGRGERGGRERKQTLLSSFLHPSLAHCRLRSARATPRWSGGRT
jgi:hypothetical protein